MFTLPVNRDWMSYANYKVNRVVVLFLVQSCLPFVRKMFCFFCSVESHLRKMVENLSPSQLKDRALCCTRSEK